MARILYICNTLQKSKYLKTGNFVKCQNQNLQQIINPIRLRSSINSILYMPEPDVQKKQPFVYLSFFFSFFPGLTQDYHDHSPYFEYKSIPFWSVHVCGTLVLRYQHSDLIVGMYSPFCEWVCLSSHFAI